MASRVATVFTGAITAARAQPQLDETFAANRPKDISAIAAPRSLTKTAAAVQVPAISSPQMTGSLQDASAPIPNRASRSEITPPDIAPTNPAASGIADQIP